MEKANLKLFTLPGILPAFAVFIQTLIAGDLLFKGGVGRWDLPGGSLEDLRKSLKRIFSELEDDVLVITGHYEETTIGQERLFNPYLRSLFA